MPRWVYRTAAAGNGAQFKPRLVRAYAEGRAVGRAGGAATLNPEDGRGTVLETAWDYGHSNQATASFKHECTA